MTTSRRAFLARAAAVAGGVAAAAITLPALEAREPSPAAPKRARATELVVHVTADTTQLERALVEAEAAVKRLTMHGLVEVGVTPRHWEYRCWVDGVEVTDRCFAANDIDGWADVYLRGDDGWFMLRHGEVVAERLRGDVLLVREGLRNA